MGVLNLNVVNNGENSIFLKKLNFRLQKYE